MKKTILSIFLGISLISSANAAVVSSYDMNKSCTLYRTTTETKPILSHESMVLNKNVYGLSLQNMDIDFLKKEVRFDLMGLVVMGINKRITNESISIDEKNPDFKVFTNQLNRKIQLLESVCLDGTNQVQSFSFFESE